MGLRIANEMELPDDAATQTYGFIARKGAGKTYAAGKLVEELLERDVPVVVIDPIGNWYGLQIGRDGSSEGYAIPVFGGVRGNVPLEPAQGEVLAQLLVSRHLSAVVDVSGFRKNDRKRFVAEFAEALFHAAKSRPTPRMIVFEEAQVFAPQRADRGAERLLGAVEDIVRLGRNYGLGSTLISQRPQSVNKEVLNQVEALFVGQLNGPQERAAISAWVSERGAGRGLLEELPRLQPGTMVLWSPQWLRTLKKVRIARKRTFDASATPVLGKARPAPQRAAALDVEELRAALASFRDRPAGTRERQARSGSAEPVADRRVVELEQECARLRARELDRGRMKQLVDRIAGELQSLHQLATELAGVLTEPTVSTDIAPRARENASTTRAVAAVRPTRAVSRPRRARFGATESAAHLRRATCFLGGALARWRAPAARGCDRSGGGRHRPRLARGSSADDCE
jgi:hypothetical protein